MILQVLKAMEDDKYFKLVKYKLLIIDFTRKFQKTKYRQKIYIYKHIIINNFLFLLSILDYLVIIHLKVDCLTDL